MSNSSPSAKGGATSLVQSPQASRFNKQNIDQLQDQIRRVYLADARPWVIGYSGGKDSTTALQLTWYALAKLPAEQRTKPVFVIASDTLVETPVIVGYIDRTLERINAVADRAKMPFQAHKVRPETKDTFWVNMIGKGYPAPYRRFRWCTDRLKISPANKFINEQVNRFGEVVLVLGVRRAESATRAQVMSLHRKDGEVLSRHTVLRSAWVYAPIEYFETDDVWSYLLSVPSPWSSDNRELVTMYRNAAAGECPLVVDTTTPSCGNSRFGCWVCTVVNQDRSMEAMIDSGQDWMEPLLDLRDWLATTQEPSRKHELREVRRRTGQVHQWGENNDKIIWGPYKMQIRKEILRRLLRSQKSVRANGPNTSEQLIQYDELHEIRRLWRTEEGDWEDSLPTIYREETGEDLDWVDDDESASGLVDSRTLEEVCGEKGLPAAMVKELIDLERRLQGLGRRVSVFEGIDRTLRKDWRTAEQVFKDINWKPEAADDDSDDGDEAVDAS